MKIPDCSSINQFSDFGSQPLQDWNGAPLRPGEDSKFKFFLGRVAERLVYGARFEKSLKGLGKINEFTEGLWYDSVVELFLFSASGENYFEYNLSPTGAWWAAVFKRYRERDLTWAVPEDNFTVDRQESADSVDVLLALPTEILQHPGDLISQTAILKYPSRSSYLVRKFSSGASARKTCNCDPDFHLRELAEEY